MGWRDAPTLNEVQRTHRPNAKPESRLQAKAAESKRTVVTDRDFKKAVRDRYRMHCCKCGRKVFATLELIPEAAHVHHCHGRNGPLRFEARCAILLCATCHQQVTGRVREKWIVVGTAFFELQTKREVITCIDAWKPVKFERVA